MANIQIKERRIKSFRYYFVQQNIEIRFLSKQELDDHIIQFMALCKKNNQQELIDKLKDNLKRFFTP